ncbi:MAG TPA: TetR/AcrR family transcriptional regulator [Gammaproteobacteria bacterium]|nr:TetR/AcrR family transcriptional regulator [Gammaproteobacteria bacterium]
MRYGEEHKAKTRDKVLKAAAKAIRADGPHRVGVAGLMSKAGLTHGGFYAHFPSKDALIAAAIEQMFAESRERFLRETENREPADALANYIDFYLSARHRDAVGDGCPISSLAGDVRRVSKHARKCFAGGAARLSARLADSLRALGNGDPDGTASSMLAEMVGALTLSRGEPDPARSDSILAASRAALKRRLGLRENPS